MTVGLGPEANPSIVKYIATSSLVRSENQIYILLWKKTALA
jgi:hypothetical protein